MPTTNDNTHALDSLKTAMDSAVAKLTRLMDSKNKAVSRAACSDLLRHGLRAYELYEIEERLQHLETIVEEKK